jgi:hypothetical protein
VDPRRCFVGVVIAPGVAAEPLAQTVPPGTAAGCADERRYMRDSFSAAKPFAFQPKRTWTGSRNRLNRSKVTHRRHQLVGSLAMRWIAIV